MRSFIALIVVATVAIAAGAFVTHTNEVKYADKQFLHQQEDLLVLLRHVYQPDWNPQLVSYAKNYKILENLGSYTNVDAVKEFYKLYETGTYLPKGEIFNIYNEVHREQAIALFEFFYYAKDFDTFYKSVAFGRYYINEGMFVYALTVAVTHRKDMAGFILPAPYEIYPYYFINTEVIQKAQQYKMQGYYGMKKVEDTYTVVIPYNYTTDYYVDTAHQEQKLTYFTEDVGLNSYYYYFHTDYPFWMGGKEYGLYNDRRGELYLFEHQQLLARYYLERLSNNMGHIPELSYYTPVKTGYYPRLQYYNGYSFPARESFYNFYHEDNYYNVELVEEYERRIRDVIDAGFLLLPDGKKIDLTKPESIEYLGNLVQSNPDSLNTRYYRYVEEFARLVMGASVTPITSYKVIPSALENFETSLRDPVFYQIYKRLIHYYYHFKDYLPSYTYDDLYFPGVKIDDVTVEKLVTYFDKFDVDITNSIDIEPEPYVDGKYETFGEIEYKPDPVVVKARLTRLNHKPFTYKLSVSSEKNTKAVVRVFIGPKYDEYGNLYRLSENRENFYELDYFMYELTAGKNTIARDSGHFYGFVQDRTSFYDLYRKVMYAYKGEDKFPLDMTEAHCGFPNRLMLPKGLKSGMPFQFYFIVSPYYEPTLPQYKGYDPIVSCGVGSGSRYVDKLPFGYPFDRQINEKYFYVPNSHFEDVYIYHKSDDYVV